MSSNSSDKSNNDSTQDAVDSSQNSETTKKYDNANNVYYTIHLVSINGLDVKRFKKLHTMYTGNNSPKKLLYLNRINDIIKSKHTELSLSKIKPSKLGLGEEVVRRHKYLQLSGTAPSTSNWPVSRSTERLSSSLYQLPEFEVEYIEDEMETFISFHENVIKEAELKEEQQGHKVKTSDRTKMRLWEAFFRSKNRSKLMKVQDLESRVQLDNRKDTRTLYDDVAEDYNDKSWVPDSRPMNCFGSKLERSFPLILIGKELSADEVKLKWVGTRGEFKVALSKWGRSGNGDGNWVASYAERAFATGSPPSSDDEGGFQSDTKATYCSSLQLGYFWYLTDLYQLTDTVAQNITSIGFSSVKGNTPNSTSNTKPRKKNSKSLSYQESTETLVSMVEKMDDRMSVQNTRLVLIKLKDNLRKEKTAISLE
jgi:hypothetical protein